MFETLGLTLRVLRELSGCSQAEIARKAQIGKSQLSKYENGKELPKLESLGKILSALGTTPLVVFYLSSVLDRATQLSGGLRADLIEQGAATFFHGDAESRRYRELFESFLTLFETAAEERVLAALPKPGCGEERIGSRRAGRRRMP
jgi:transcriptional regulator with XRE-family HTH domain